MTIDASSFLCLSDAVILQVQSWGAVDAQQLKGHVLLNGASLTGANQEVDAIIKSMSVHEHLPSANLTSVLSKSQPSVFWPEM